MRKRLLLIHGLALILLAGAAGRSVVRAQAIGRGHVPSKERVDPLERRRDDIDGNNVRATITNWLQTAQSGSQGDFWYEWPKNTRRIYVSLTQLWVGAQVKANVGSNPGQTLYIVDVADFRQNRFGGTNSWTFEPIKGYVNPAGSEYGIAQSDDPESWPPFWPDKLDDQNDPGWRGSWNGLFGKNIFNADQEFFFKAGDDQYDRYLNAYRPDSTDPSRGGLGLIVEARYMAWSQILIDDVVFLLYEVKNDGTEDLERVGFTVWLADCVGGDCGDDIPYFDILEDVAFMTDRDGVGDQNFGPDPVGVAAITFLETPGNGIDRIDNDADGSTGNPDCSVAECNSPVVPEAFLEGENPLNGIDDNNNGLIDENASHVPFQAEQGSSPGVGYADYIDNDDDGEVGSPVVTPEMVLAAAGDRWNRWPPNPESDPLQQRANGRPIVHLVGVGQEDVGHGFKDGIDNDNTCDAQGHILAEPGSPRVTQEMIDAAATDPYRRYRLPGTDLILYDVGPEDLGKCYADGVDNDGDGAVDEGIDEGIDEMIDERRDDGLDNDGDWNPLSDDTGLDGVAFSSDPGEADGLPTSGAGTSFPGERNIDKTDVSESDQIGITNVQVFGANTLDLSNTADQTLFNTFMLPGELELERPPAGDNDLAVSSGLFPLRAGQIERISLAIVLAAGRDEALQGRDYALSAYSEDYQFAQAPLTPTVVAVPGDGRVTLYWDTKAEESVDSYLESIGLNGRDFEGYRIYRATDPAFLDALVITDGFGNLTFRKPIAQFDLKDGIRGFHPVDINGIKFYLGDDTGIRHVFVDTTVTNGITYYYAVTAYDFGAAEANIAPTETPIRIRRLPDGTIETGPNVVRVTPTAPVAGYRNAELENVDGFLPRVQGFTTSRIGYQIIDSRAVRDGARYRVVFEDTLIPGTRTAPDTLTTKNFSLIDITDPDNPDTLIRRSTAFKPGREVPIVDGFQLIFFPDPYVVQDRTKSGWNNPDVYDPVMEPFVQPPFVKGLRNPADYRVEIVGDGEVMSEPLRIGAQTIPARPTNVRVVNISTGQEVKFAFLDRDNSDGGILSDTPARFTASPEANPPASDYLVLIEPLPGGGEGVTWRISLDITQTGRRNPQQGDVATLITRKPFLSSDVFEFTARGPTVDREAARSLLDQIRVVPNPYIATNRFEQQNPYSTGRGPRAIHFIHLPPQATVRIFTISGRLVRTLRLNEGSNDGLDAASLMNGTLVWDLLTEDGLEVSYGVYLYHVEAPGIGEKTGTFAIIK